LSPLRTCHRHLPSPKKSASRCSFSLYAAVSDSCDRRYEPETDTAVNTKRLSFQRQELPTTAAFPPTVITDPWPLNRESLEAYIRHVNKQGIVRLHLWYRARTLQEPSTAEVMSRRTQLTYLRLTIPDLLVAYLDIEQKTEEKSGYQVLLVTVFGIREKARNLACESLFRLTGAFRNYHIVHLTTLYSSRCRRY